VRKRLKRGNPKAIKRPKGDTIGIERADLKDNENKLSKKI
jgi:hypothetical protein